MKILIAGDSFAWGSWADGKTVHGGIAQLAIENGNYAKICGIPSAGVEDSIIKLQKALSEETFDRVIFFVTDIFRYARLIGNEQLNKPLRGNMTDHTSIGEVWQSNLPFEVDFIKYMIRKRVRENFCQLNRLNVPIDIVGGLTVIEENDIMGLENLTLASPSIFLTCDSKLDVPIVAPYSLVSGIMTRRFPCTQETVNGEVVEYLEELERKWNAIMESKWCGNDIRPTDSHPSKLAFETLYDHLNIPSGNENERGSWKVDTDSEDYEFTHRQAWVISVYCNHYVKTIDKPLSYEDWVEKNKAMLLALHKEIMEQKKIK